MAPLNEQSGLTVLRQVFLRFVELQHLRRRYIMYSSEVSFVC